MCWFWFEHLDTMILVIAVFLYIAFDFMQLWPGHLLELWYFLSQGLCCSSQAWCSLSWGFSQWNPRLLGQGILFHISLSLYIFLNCVGKILELLSWWMLDKIIRDGRKMGFRISSEEFYSNAILNSVSLIWTVLAKTCILEMCKICWFFPFLSLMGCNCSGAESALPGCPTSNSNEDLAARLSSASYQVRELFQKARNNIFLNM